MSGDDRNPYASPTSEAPVKAQLASRRIIGHLLMAFVLSAVRRGREFPAHSVASGLYDNVWRWELASASGWCGNAVRGTPE